MNRLLLICVAAVLLVFAAGLLRAPLPVTAHVSAPPVERITPGPAGADISAPAAPTPALTTSGSAGTSSNAGQWFLGAALVAIGVAGATLMLRLMRGLPRHPPSNR